MRKTQRQDNFSRQFLAIDDMQGALFYGKRSFLYRFAQGRMRVSGATKILRAPAEFDDGDSFRN